MASLKLRERRSEGQSDWPFLFFVWPKPRQFQQKASPLREVPFDWFRYEATLRKAPWSHWESPLP
jgi:hypothetical protein